MNSAKFSIDRPIFPAVLSAIILPGPVISMFLLPSSVYPSVVPPSVTVKAQYPATKARGIGATDAWRPEAHTNGIAEVLYLPSAADRPPAPTANLTSARSASCLPGYVIFVGCFPGLPLARPALSGHLQQPETVTRRRLHEPLAAAPALGSADASHLPPLL
ncbi:efflux RND transporter permease subunit, partial [Burkholderia cenocepacia]|uniref:efflux RND transporter permease subunit n=1 Tax=Burkholderia cenocepacia TaxID=95486 RepID=UPI00406CE632